MSRPTRPADPSQRSLFDESAEPACAGLVTPPSAAPSAAAGAGSAQVFRHPEAQRDVLLGGHLVGYRMRRARRRSIGFVVGAEGLSVSAPRWVGVREIDLALREKSHWILSKLREQRERAARLQASRIDWRDGGALPFLGDTLVLLLDQRTTGVMLDNDVVGLPGVPRRLLRIGLPHDVGPEQIRDAAQSWLQRQARRVFEQRCAVFAARLGVDVRRLSLSSAATRWGSASADGSIRLNWRLIHFGTAVIDYVVVHEVCHLAEFNHSKAFWQLVARSIPEYAQRRKQLQHVRFVRGVVQK